MTLIERATVPPFKPGEILEPIIRYPLRALDLVEGFETLGALRIAGNLSLWGEDESVETAAVFSPHGSGYLVDRAQMERWLLGEAATAGVKLLLGARRFEGDLTRDRPCMAWEDNGRRCEARPAAIIEASGRGAGAIAAGRRRRLDRLIALLAYHARPSVGAPDQRLVIESAADGWWYSAPLPNGRAVMAFMTDADLVPRGRTAQRRFFAERLERSRLMKSRAPGSGAHVRAYPAATTIREPHAGPAWMAIGDAAVTHDPLLGRGVSTAIANGVAIGSALTSGGNITHAIYLSAEAQRAAFADYLSDHCAVYARESRRGRFVFWRRRVGHV